MLEGIAGTLILWQPLFLDYRNFVLGEQEGADAFARTGFVSTELSSVGYQSEFSSQWESLAISVNETGVCMVEANQCVTDDWLVYVLNENGKLVKSFTGDGNLNAVFLFK